MAIEHMMNMSSHSQLHRHAARYPTPGAGEDMKAALGKLGKREIKSPRRHPELDFLSKADLNMTGWHLDGLMDQGRKA